MILTCPSCGTQYAVKDGAIPPQGRQVRCASCKHAWHQDPEGGAAEDSPPPADQPLAAPPATSPNEGSESDEADGDVGGEVGGGVAGASDMGRQFEGAPRGEPAGDAPPAPGDPADPAEPIDPVAPPGDALVEDTPVASAGGEWSPPQPAYREEPAAEPQHIDDEPAFDEDFSPFVMEEHAPRGRSPVLTLLMIAVLIAALAAAFWFLAPAEWKERVGIAAAGETPLQLMMTHSDRQKLASGNELLAVSGRVINPTDELQNVPPIRAQLRSSSGRLVYSWTIAPPARTLPPGASATFNSAEVNVPSGGDELTITLGSANT